MRSHSETANETEISESVQMYVSTFFSNYIMFHEWFDSWSHFLSGVDLNFLNTIAECRGSFVGYVLVVEAFLKQ